MAGSNTKLKNFETNYAKLEEMGQSWGAADLTLQEALEVG